MDNGLPITPAASFTRNLLRVADFLPFCYGFAIVSMLLRADCKRLGDIAAATLVVHQPRTAAQDRARQRAARDAGNALSRRRSGGGDRPCSARAALTGERLDELAALAASGVG